MKEEEGLVSFKVVGSGLLSTEFCFVRSEGRVVVQKVSSCLLHFEFFLSFFFHDRIIHISIELVRIFCTSNKKRNCLVSFL